MTVFDRERIRLLLAASQATLTSGLRDPELRSIEERFEFTFGADHRELLAVALPVGAGWPDWRHGPEEQLRARLAWPVDGIIFDVEHSSFWPPSWSRRPDDTAAAVAVARARMGDVPRLVPLFGHRYLPAEVPDTGYPVLSVHQSDTIYYGRDILDYLEREFTLPTREPVQGVRRRIPFWSALAESRFDEL